MRKILHFGCYILFSCSLGCSFIGDSEVVMTDGMIIEGTNNAGYFRIEAGSDGLRTYSWAKRTEQFQLSPQWFTGFKGLYCPSGKNMHAVLTEGQQHFVSEEEIYPWFNLTTSTQAVYTSDGLVIDWKEVPHPTEDYSALIVDVWQIYVKGKKPKNLRLSSDESINIINRDKGISVAIGNPSLNEAKVINGRKYLGRALDQMRRTRATFTTVEEVIQNGERFMHEKGYAIYGVIGDRPWDLTCTVAINSDGDVVDVYQ